MKQVRFVCSAVAATLCYFQLSACGRGGSSDEDAPARGKLDSAFFAASVESGVPMRLMMAVGFVESGLQPARSSALYLTPGSAAGSQAGIDFGDSAFGLPLDQMMLTNDSSSSSLESQVRAYGHFLKDKFKTNALPLNAVTPEEKVRWIWRLAELHHGGDQQHRNLWSIFAHEMMATLNKGFDVRDVETGEVIHLDKENPPIKEDQLPQNLKQDLALDTYHSDIRPASLFSLVSTQQTNVINHPKSVEVIHCPFSLTVCIDLQQKRRETGARLGAHYIIPGDDLASPGVLQMARHDEPVELTDTTGKVELVKDRIIVMLAGNSGRYVDGVRTYVNPLWLSDYHLRLLGAVVTEICSVLERTDGVNRGACVTPNSPGGVVFRNQPGSNYRWGDISDFDESIFYPYVVTGAGALGSTTIETADGQTSYDVGQSFSLLVKFQPSALRIELDRLVRCGKSDNRVVWEADQSPQVRNVTSKAIDQVWYDVGPNANGDQFFRAKVFGDNSKFLGWAIQQIQLKNVKSDPKTDEGMSKYCIRNGS